MKKLTYTLFLCLLVQFATAQQSDGEPLYSVRDVMSFLKSKSMNSKQLRSGILSEFTKQPEGIFAVALKDLDTGEKFFINEFDSFPVLNAKNNINTTAYDLMVATEKLSNGESVSNEASAEMVKVLMKQHHKNNDSGIIVLPDGRRYLLVLLSRGTDEYACSQTLASVSHLIHTYIQNKHRTQ
ncbi:serine hydrolase [Arcticibacter svalbardensis]|uniref:hypothetical protein n=1 Tax=Arcticibacter svalbardensis TaxID=1288027 RepID=UPI0012695719|nr:hypothetical protein [Arcticibacter svalbardensis]